MQKLKNNLLLKLIDLHLKSEKNDTRFSPHSKTKKADIRT